MNERTKNVLGIVLRVALSVGLLAYLYTKIDVKETWVVVKSSEPIFIFLAYGCFLIIHFFLFLRWWLFVRALGLAAPLLSVVRYFFIGLFGNLFLPTAVGGDVIKTIGLCQQSDEKPKVVASVLLDRLSGFAGMTVIALLAFPFAFRLVKDMSLLVLILIMTGAVLLLGVILFVEKFYEFCCRVFSAFPKVKNALMQVHYDAALLKGRRGVLYQTVIVSAVSQMVLVLTFYLIARAMHQEVPIIYFLIFVPMICVASSMPSLGGLGVREAGAAYLFAKVGMDPGVAVSVSLMSFLFMVVTGVFGGGFYAVTKNPSSRT